MQTAVSRIPTLMLTCARRVPLIVLAGLLPAACSDDPAAPATPAITSEGGTVTSPDGRVTLEIPAGALTRPTRITIERAPATVDASLLPGSEYVFEPDGLQFAVPARLSIRYDSVPEDLADRTQFLWLHRRSGNGWTPMVGQPIDLEKRIVSGEIDGFSSYGIGVPEFAEALLVAATQLDALATNVVGDGVIAFLGTIAAIAQATEHPAFQPVVEPFLAGMRNTACAAYVSAIDNARNAPVNDWGLFTALLEPIYRWEAIAVGLGVENGCPNAPYTLGQLEQLKFTQFTDFYLARLDPASFGNDFALLLDEARRVGEMRAEVTLLGLPSVDALLLEQAQYPLMDALRTAAYVACRSVGVHDFLGRLRHALAWATYSDEDLLVDLQQCGTRIEWSLVSGDAAIAAQGTLGGGAEPGAIAAVQNAPGIATGTLTLGGLVRAFRCPDGSVAGDELIVTLGDVEVASRGAAGGMLIGEPLVLDAAAILEAAGIDPDAPADVPLRIARRSDGCLQYVQSPGFAETLATLRLGYPVPPDDDDPAPDLSGTWTLVVADVCSGLLNVTQEGNALSVSGSISGTFCPYNASGTGTGQINGSSIEFGVALGSAGGESGQVEFTGTVSADAGSMSGTFEGASSGSWYASRQ